MLSMCWLLQLDNIVLNTLEWTTYPHSAIFSLRVGFFVFFIVYCAIYRVYSLVSMFYGNISPV